MPVEFRCCQRAALVMFAVIVMICGGCAGPGEAKEEVGEPAAVGAFMRSTIDVGIVVSDIEKSAKFYTEALGFTEVLGFDVSRELSGDSGLADYKEFKVRVFVLGDEPTATRIKLMEIPGTASAKVDNTYIHSSLGLSYLTIFLSDTTASVERARQAGAKTVKAPLQIGDGNMYLTVVKDPDGNNVEFVGPKK